MVRRTGCRAQRAHFLNQVIFQLRRGNQRFGFLIQVGFVGRTAAFGDAQEFVLVTIDTVEVDLCRQIGAGVYLFVHIQCGILGIAQVILDEGVIHTLRQAGFVAAAGPDSLPFFTHDDCGAGVLTGRQNAFGRNFRITQELQRNVFVVFAGFRVMKNGSHLLLMRRAQHERGIVERLLRQKR
ncbi:hypothetical protein SRABI106_02373 [Rahnella aquatilis]|nr:hypothetical protein SRABI106_02373 [Rahnella aquatilis]